MLILTKFATGQFRNYQKVKDRVIKKGDMRSEDVILKEIAQKRQRRGKFIIPYHSIYKLIWDALIIIMAITIFIVDTLSYAFGYSFYMSRGYSIFNLVVDAIFAFDMLVIFRTTKISSKTG
jgi:hypothetical protein